MQEKQSLIGLIIFGIFLMGCTNVQMPAEGNTNTSTGADTAMKVENGDSIKVEYIGKFPDSGEVFDKSEGRGPLEFTVGAGQMIQGFDEAVVGMELNEEKTVQIPPEKAYGTAEDAQRIEAPVEQIAGEGETKVGMAVYTNTGMPGKIVKIENGTATAEFAHPLAGKTLEFWIKVIEITKAK